MLKKLFLSASILLSSFTSYANDFSAAISPPRFELQSKRGELNRGIIEITNVGTSSAVYNIKTNDWFFDENYNVNFSDELFENSCRPWVSLESESVTVLPKQTRKYRFNVNVPAETNIDECRFVILVEGDESVLRSKNVDLPVSSRVGIIVYLTLDGSKARFDVLNMSKSDVNGSLVPTIDIVNNGTSHGRLSGFINVVDKENNKYVLTPDNFPILPTYKRTINLIPQNKSDGENVHLIYPIKLKGDLHWDGGKFHIDQYLE